MRIFTRKCGRKLVNTVIMEVYDNERIRTEITEKAVVT